MQGFLFLRCDSTSSSRGTVALWGFFTPDILTRGIFTPTFTPSNNPMEPKMSRHRFLRIASRRDRLVRYREVWVDEDSRFTPEQEAALDLGCVIQTEEGTAVDLIAYFEVSEAERGQRALDLVS